jgi:TRAP-type mannitol/chloroaromatic compound transport system permease small subunit
MSNPTKEPQFEVADELIAEARQIGDLPDDMAPWMKKIITIIDTFSQWTGKTVCWLTVPIFVSMFYEVVARHFFIAPTIWAYDVSRMLYGALFMLGAGYALMRGVHIRADFIYRNWKPKTQARVDFILYFFLYFPSMIAFLIVTVDYASLAWMRDERGMDTAWMPAMAPIKSAIPIGVSFLIIQGVSEILKCVYAIKNNRWP